MRRRTIAFALKQAELGGVGAGSLTLVGYLRCHVLYTALEIRGISPSELKHMRQPEEENLRMKKLVADLSPDKAML